MQKYTENSAIRVIEGKHKDKKGYIDCYDELDSTYLIIEGISETTKCRIKESEMKVLNTNYFIWGFEEKETVDDIDIQNVIDRINAIREVNNGMSISDIKKGKKIIAREYKENLCFSCLKECEDIKEYKLGLRGYGSTYDGTTSKLQLCSSCREGIDKGLDKIFNEVPAESEYLEDYNYEEILRSYIDTLPLEGQELFDNTLTQGWTSYRIDAQDWLDIETKIATDSVYKKNGFYSPSEIDTYYDRFPKCDNTYIKTYNDGSRGSYCRLCSASGNVEDIDGTPTVIADKYNISIDCYYCNSFILKDEFKKSKIEETKKVELKEVVMFEYFCPNCGDRRLLHKDNCLSDYIDYDFCSKCNQEVSFDLDKWFDDCSCEEDDCAN